MSATELRHTSFDKLTPELREARLRLRVDELRHERDVLRVSVRDLKNRVSRKDIRLRAMRLELNELVAKVRFLEREAI